jgi:hypothetical protein
MEFFTMNLKIQEEWKSFCKSQEDYNLMCDPNEHYMLLSYLSYQYNNVNIFDLGSYRGFSAIALSSNPTNKIISYDIDYFLDILDRPKNVEFRIGDFFTELDILSSPLIMFDVDPHDGEIEFEFIEWLSKKQYKGSVIFDDIHLNSNMRNFWKNIKQDRIDLTEFGHWSGTGMVKFK